MNKYIEEFVKLKCSPDLLLNNLFPNAKEITESFACYEAVRQHLWGEGEGVSPSNPDIKFFAVGDGCQPRTAATFAYRTAWECISIDPLLRTGNNKYLIKHDRIKKLYLFRNGVENITEKIIGNLESKIVVIGMVHSHADIERTYQALKGRETYIISIPCCLKHKSIFGKLPDIEYIDENIESRKNLIKIWKFK
jgi:hypothetical protein